ncbi:hypothetical protein CR513_60811, partial [Mucuna pruriens]
MKRSVFLLDYFIDPLTTNNAKVGWVKYEVSLELRRYKAANLKNPISMRQPFVVCYDISKMGLRGVLMQEGKSNSANHPFLEDLLRACILEQRSSWDNLLPLVEFTYNNSYGLFGLHCVSLSQAKA